MWTRSFLQMVSHFCVALASWIDPGRLGIAQQLGNLNGVGSGRDRTRKYTTNQQMIDTMNVTIESCKIRAGRT